MSIEHAESTKHHDPQLEEMPELVIITGMSGAGRTEAMHTFQVLLGIC